MVNLLEVGVAFELFGLTIKWYGIIIATGVLVAVLVACYNNKLKNYDKDFPYEVLLWCFPLAIVGARIYYIIFSGQSYTFMEAIAIWNGGMAIYGGIIGGLIGLILFSVIRNQNLLKITDLVAPSLVIAQTIGRWGNYANQEVYGKVVTNPDLQWFPFSVYIDKLGEWHYATFFYESMICVIIFVILMLVFRRVKMLGIVTSLYLILYGIERFFLEGMRQESEILFIGNSNIPVSQVVSILFVIAGIALMIGVIFNERKKIKNQLNKIYLKNNINDELDVKNSITIEKSINSKNIKVNTLKENVNTEENEKNNKSNKNLNEMEKKIEENNDI